MDPMLTSAQVREICGQCSDMTLWRHVKHSDFPKPVYVNRRRYWRADDVRAWWKARSEEAPPSPRSAATADA